MDSTPNFLVRGLTLSSIILENGEKLPGECIETAFLSEFSDAEEAQKFIRNDPLKVDEFVIRIVARACKLYKLFDRVQSFDPVRLSEELAGGEEDPLLSLALIRMKSEILKKVLAERKDYYWACPISLYLDILNELHFKLVMEIPINNEDKFYIFSRPDGLLLRFDTYMGKSVNGASLYYNWKPNPEYWKNNDLALTESGHWKHPDEKPGDRQEKPRTELIWIGYSDAREGIRGTIEMLEKHGNFFPKWIESPNLWLCHHGDTDQRPNDYAYYREVNAKRRGMLPKHVKEMIGD